MTPQTAAEPPPDARPTGVVRILHLSDLHFSAALRTAVDPDMLDAMVRDVAGFAAGGARRRRRGDRRRHRRRHARGVRAGRPVPGRTAVAGVKARPRSGDDRAGQPRRLRPARRGRRGRPARAAATDAAAEHAFWTGPFGPAAIDRFRPFFNFAAWYAAVESPLAGAAVVPVGPIGAGFARLNSVLVSRGRNTRDKPDLVVGALQLEQTFAGLGARGRAASLLHQPRPPRPGRAPSRHRRPDAAGCRVVLHGHTQNHGRTLSVTGPLRPRHPDARRRRAAGGGLERRGYQIVEVHVPSGALTVYGRLWNDRAPRLASRPPLRRRRQRRHDAVEAHRGTADRRRRPRRRGRLRRKRTSLGGC